MILIVRHIFEVSENDHPSLTNHAVLVTLAQGLRSERRSAPLAWGLLILLLALSAVGMILNTK